MVAEFHRKYLENQDSLCIATDVLQIALNNDITWKLKNLVNKLTL
jgi:hypothetical protein